MAQIDSNTLRAPSGALFCYAFVTLMVAKGYHDIAKDTENPA